jgi:hypothetical protein
MKTISRNLTHVLASSFFLGCGIEASAQFATDDTVPTIRGDRTRGVETRQDLPGDFHPYYGQKLNRYRDLDRRIAKIDLDADLNMDGVIRQGDVRDAGAFEQTPPGLIVGVKEMSKVVIDVIPYRVDFQGFCVVSMEISGLNRGTQSGQFGSLEEEQSAVGRVKVWRDIERKTLLLDSGDSTKRVVEFAVPAMRYPANLPTAIPRTVYVEGVKPSGQYLGDLRLLAVVSHRYKQDARQDMDDLIQASKETTAAKEPVQVEKVPSPILKRFRTSFDHILITVENQPALKEFVNANAEKVWVDLR